MLDPYTGQPAEVLFDAKDVNRGHPGEFRYFKGPSGFIFIEDIPSNLGEYYSGGYDPIPETKVELAERAAADAYKMEPITRLGLSGRYLEIGPWIGLAAYNALQAGFDVTTLERSEDCVAFMRGNGINAIQTSDPAESIQELDGQFDVIVLWHSIEHLPRPWVVLDRAMRALAPGGVILVAAPNPESAQMRAQGRNWYHLDAPRHLYLLPIAMIEEIGAANGLALVEKTTDDHRGRLEDDYGWKWPFRQRLKNIPVARRFLPDILGPLVAKWYRKKGAADGATYTVILRKPK